jgi:hypothetical protein
MCHSFCRRSQVKAIITCVQEMNNVKQLIQLMNLNVKLQMTIKVDKKRAKDLVNNWSTGGRTRYMTESSSRIKGRWKYSGLLD